MGMVRRRTRRRTMMVAGGLAYERGQNAQATDDQGYAEPAPPPAPPAPAPAADDAASEIERLASLHDSGALTDDEFAAAKPRSSAPSPRPSQRPAVDPFQARRGHWAPRRPQGE